MTSKPAEREAQPEQLRRSNEKKSAATRQKVEDAIALLVRDGEAVNVSAVHRASGVSRGYIYATPELLASVNAASSQRLRKPTALKSTSDASLEARLRVALDTIAQLKAEKATLERRVESLTAQVFELSTR